MIFTYITFSFFVFLIIYALIKRSWGVSVYLIIIYAISAYFSIKIVNQYSDYRNLLPNNSFDMIIPTILYCSMLFLTFQSYFKPRPNILGFTNLNEQRRFIRVGYTISIILIIGIVLVLPKLQFAINYGVGSLRNDLTHGDVSFNETGITSVGTTILLYLGNLCYPLLLMFFYSLIHIRGKVTFKLLLLIGSFSEVVLGVFVGGRTNIIYYALFLIFSIVVFFQYMSRKVKKITIITAAVLGLIIFAYVIAVSIGRFSTRSQGLNYYYETYAGQSYVYFCNFIYNDHWHPYSLQRIFPMISYFILGRLEINDYRALIFHHTRLNIGCFYTFLGDIFVDIGIFGLIIFVLAFRKITSKVILGDEYNISKILYLGLTYTIPLFGVFYYYPWQKYVTFCFFLTVIIAKYINGNLNFKKKRIFSIKI